MILFIQIEILYYIFVLSQQKDKIEEIKGKENKDTNREEKDDLFDDDLEEEEDEEEESEDEEGEDLESLTQFLREIEDNMASNERNRLDEQLLVR